MVCLHPSQCTSVVRLLLIFGVILPTDLYDDINERELQALIIQMD